MSGLWGTGWIHGNNYKARAKIAPANGKEGEQWYVEENGQQWSAFDVTYRPDSPSVDERENIDIFNGEVWEQQPSCLQARTQWINGDQWILLSIPYRAADSDGSAMMAMTEANGKMFYTAGELQARLKENGWHKVEPVLERTLNDCEHYGKPTPPAQGGTPRTDEILADHAHWQEYRELARQIESELAEANTRVKGLEDAARYMQVSINQLQVSYDGAEALAASLRSAIALPTLKEHRDAGLTAQMVRDHYPQTQHQPDECQLCDAVFKIAAEALTRSQP